MANLMNDITWIKTNGFIKKKYGKSLTYRAIKLIMENQTKVNPDDFYSLGEDLIIPIQLKNLDLGDVIVNHGSSLDFNQKNEVTDLVRFLVTPKIYSLQLRQMEENLRYLSKRPLFMVDSRRVMKLHESKSPKKIVSPIVFLKSNIQINRNKVALKVHEMTERNLFVYLDDIADSITSQADFRMLNDITIYIDDIEQISDSVLLVLQEYLDTNDDEGPLFLVGSSLNLNGIKLKNWNDSFKSKANQFYLDIDRIPIDQQMSEDVLELLFV